jgi:plasmid stabilization system protein ParE
VRTTWLPRAKRALRDYLFYLREQAPNLVPEAEQELREAALQLGDFPYAHREARWPGLRELPLRRWKKLIVYRVEADRVVIVAFFDLRQDLAAQPPPGEAE